MKQIEQKRNKLTYKRNKQVVARGGRERVVEIDEGDLEVQLPVIKS